MTIAKLKLDTATVLDFGVAISGADGHPEVRFVIEGKDFSVSVPCERTSTGVSAKVPPLKNIISSGIYPAHLDVVLDGKFYRPLSEKVEFEPLVEFKIKPKVEKKVVKESVAIAVKSGPLQEDQLRKVQAATIIANSLGYSPTKNETPGQIINSAIESVSALTLEQIETVQEMLALAEAVGVDFNRDLFPSATIPPEEIVESEEPKIEEIAPLVEKEEKSEEQDKDEWSDSEIDQLVDTVDDWEDIIDAYEPGELIIIDPETGEVVDELKEELDEQELNEVMSRVERIRARMWFHKSEAKRERKLKVALKKHSSSAQINHRARTMAIKMMKIKLARKPLDQMSVADKERVEKIISKRKKTIDRMAMKMTQKVRAIERNRLSNK